MKPLTVKAALALMPGLRIESLLSTTTPNAVRAGKLARAAKREPGTIHVAVVCDEDGRYVPLRWTEEQADERKAD